MTKNVLSNEGGCVVVCDNIHKTYLLGIEGVPALRGVSLEVREGELLMIYGTSGGGKSTLLNVLGTIDVPTKGNLAIFGQRLTDRSPDAELANLRCHHLGFVFQSFNLLSTMTALENVTLPMTISASRSTSEMEERAKQLLSDVGLSHRLNHYPSMLSGGEQQRVTIARALANEPNMLLLDEPTGDLDTRNTDLVMSILLNLNRTRRLTMVMVTHDLYMKPYANRVLYLRDGRVHRIEEVDHMVREKALAELERKVVEHNRVLAAGGGPGSAARLQPVQREVRAARDYATFAAQRTMNLDEDPEMQEVVGILFATNISKRQQEQEQRQQFSSRSGGGAPADPADGPVGLI